MLSVACLHFQRRPKNQILQLINCSSNSFFYAELRQFPFRPRKVTIMKMKIEPQTVVPQTRASFHNNVNNNCHALCGILTEFG